MDDFLPQVKSLKGPTNVPARTKLIRQFWDWIADAVVGSFESEPVQTKYSRFNENGHPFSTSIELTVDGRTDSPVILWSNVRKFKRRSEKKPPREKPAQAKPDYSSGWQRYYFDDGKTRRFWYIQCQGATQTIVEGDLGTDGKSTTKKLKSPHAAKEAVQKAIDEKVARRLHRLCPRGHPLRQPTQSKHRADPTGTRRIRTAAGIPPAPRIPSSCPGLQRRRPQRL